MQTSHPQAHRPHVKVHAYFAPVTPPPSVGGSGQRLCRCCIILWHKVQPHSILCLVFLLLWKKRTGLQVSGRSWFPDCYNGDVWSSSFVMRRAFFFPGKKSYCNVQMWIKLVMLWFVLVTPSFCWHENWSAVYNAGVFQHYGIWWTFTNVEVSLYL